MPEFPYLRPQAAAETAVCRFSGLDRRVRPADGALRAGRQLDPDGFPALCPSAPFARTEALTNATDLVAACGGLGWIADGTFYWNGAARGSVSAGRHQLAVIGTKIVIFPDKLLFDTAGTDGLTGMEAVAIGQAVFTADTVTFETDAPFRAGDGVTLSGCTSLTANNKTVVVREVSGKTVTCDAECFASGAEAAVTARRAVPALDFVCEKDNRLWGVHDGKICCSVLGDPCNWNVFEGLAGDGWETAVGTGGDFTGCAAYASHVLFFKEDCVHKVYGVKPSNFQVQVSRIPGVQAGCERSILNVGETVYWWARDGLVAYGGGVPDRLSAPLGEDGWESVCAGAVGHTLYLSGLRAGVGETTALNLETGLFAPQDETQALAFAGQAGTLYALRDDGLYAPDPDAVPAWEAVLGPFGDARGARRLLSRIVLVIEPESTCELTVRLSADGGPFEPVWAGAVLPPGVLRIPVVLRDGERFALRLSGRGRMRVRALVTRTRSGGSL